MRIIRVFPRRTTATPVDSLVCINRGPLLMDRADEIHISVTFSWDLTRSFELQKQWESVGHVRIGGPAIGQCGEDFVPGKYLRAGYVITSRGCPNKCWFCSVWKREGPIRELPIVDGWNVQDDNLLACSDKHVQSVFSMLRRQDHSVKFMGGLEAARLKDWHVDELSRLNLKAVVFAYDTADDLEPLRKAGRMLVSGGIISKRNTVARCYVLVGFPKDTFGRADERVNQAMSAGFVPYVMIYRSEGGSVRPGWNEFVRRSHGRLPIMQSICEYKRRELFH